MRRQRRIRLALSYAVLITWTLVMFFPMYWLVITAFKPGVAVATGPTYLPFVDFEPGLHAFREVFFTPRGEMAARPFLNSTITALSSSAVALFVGSMAGYSLARFRFGWPGSDGIAFLFLAQRMFPTAVLVIPFLIMYRELELLDTRLGLSIAYTAFGVPFVVWVMRDFFLGLPVEIEESALIDGCDRLGVLSRIVLPLAAPGLVAVFILIMIGAWNEYLFALVLTFTDAVTIPLFLQIQSQTVLGTAWWNLAAISLVSVVPVIAAGLALERYITRGLTFGAVK
jgi:multiple sugar transport system permease protein